MINTQKRTITLYRRLDSPLLLRNKSCECLDCGGPLIKCIEDNCNIYTFEFARRQIPQHQLSVAETEVIDISPNLNNNSIKTSSGPQPLENSKIKVALEQPKRDNLKLNRLIEKVKKLQEKSLQNASENNIQMSANISPSVSSPSPINHRKTEISEVPLIQIIEVPSLVDIALSQTPFISRVYNAFRNRSCPISTPLFQQSNIQNNEPILNFADGCRKAMIQEPRKQVSTCPSEHIVCDNQIRLKSLNDCLKNLLNGKKINFFIKRKYIPKKKMEKKEINVYLRK